MIYTALNKPYYIIHSTAFASGVIFVPIFELHRCNLHIFYRKDD
nr:MAG TPA: hypothetical protein [Caudoviricetes sp.]